MAGILELAPRGPAASNTDAAALPPDLRELQPLLEEWGRTDDSERSDLIDAADTSSLEELVRRVGPKLERIADFLRDHTTNGPSVAGSLDALAQAVMEAEQELQRRSSG